MMMKGVVAMSCLVTGMDLRMTDLVMGQRMSRMERRQGKLSVRKMLWILLLTQAANTELAQTGREMGFPYAATAVVAVAVAVAADCLM